MVKEKGNKSINIELLSTFCKTFLPVSLIFKTVLRLIISSILNANI